MRRIERLINLIAALLEARRPMTADEIRQSIAGYDQANRASFRRSFERDKDALRTMGIPLELRADPLTGGDAYLIPKARYYLPDLDLEADELAALRIAADAILGGADAARAGMMKLAGEVDSVPSAGPRIVWGADLAAEQPLLGPLYTAVLERQRMTFGYQRSGSDAVEVRDVEPYSLVHRRGHWYLVGRDRDRDGMRSFKVSRIHEPIEYSVGDFAVPEGLDTAAALGGEAWEVGSDEPVTAVLRWSENMRWWAEQNFPRAATKEHSGGALDVELPVANLQALASWVIGFGGEVEIVEPEEARAVLLDYLTPFTAGTS
jgi:proteasome accessory factor B